MTKAARISVYGPDLLPVTMVLHEDELALTFAEAVAEQKPLPGGLVVVDEFETEQDLMGATFEAMARQRERVEREHHMAVMYHYNAGLLPRMREDAVLTQTVPSPLSTDELIDVLEQLSEHPAYAHQLMVAISEDEQIVTMRDGDAKVVRDGGRNGDAH